jgi:hypothetical protein
MTDKIIVYANSDGSLSFVYPSVACGLSVNEIARKDVPNGVPYLIVDASDLPADRTYRDAWTADFSQPDGVGIGAEAWFAERAEQESE